MQNDSTSTNLCSIVRKHQVYRAQVVTEVMEQGGLHGHDIFSRVGFWVQVLLKSPLVSVQAKCLKELPVSLFPSKMEVSSEIEMVGLRVRLVDVRIAHQAQLTNLLRALNTQRLLPDFGDGKGTITPSSPLGPDNSSHLYHQ